MIVRVFLAIIFLSFSSSQEFECPGPGIWSDPDNCQCYYNCANHVAYQDCCPEGTLWNEVYYDCDYEDLVDCGNRPRPGSTRPSTVEPSTTITTTTQTTSPGTSETTPTPIVTNTTPGGSSTTTSSVGPTGPHPALPKKVLGMYILLADDTEDGYHSDNDDWEPLLYPYQQDGSNVLFFTFINPATMEVPVAFRKLAATRGKDTEGAVPADTLIIFAIGGYAYSLNPNPWDWLTSQQKAEQMAVQVAGWREEYKIDVINASWKVGGTSNNLADTVGLMVYEGTQALQYVKNYAEGSSQWEGFPIQVDVPRLNIL